MRFSKSGVFIFAILVGSLPSFSGQDADAQSQSQPATKTTKKSKAGAESCDGALDIVPVKSMSFTRKRRPAKTEQPKSAEAKLNNS